MRRNLDMTSLRSFVAVAESGGVTKAAGFLNLTQSAVSMQLKRLEEGLNLGLFDRGGRTIGLTTAGEQLLGYAKRMLALNDEIFGRLTAQQYEGEVVLGVPHDILYPAIPQVLQRLAVAYPRVKVRLISSFTTMLRETFARGEAEIILTTEDTVGAGGETLAVRPLIWVGAPGGQAWKQRPLRLAHERDCIFRQGAQRRLDEAGIKWEMAVESDSTRSTEVTVSADLAVHTMIEGTEPQHFERIAHGGSLPDLRRVNVNLYVGPLAQGPVVTELAALIRQAYCAG
jgi:DNA-binding transcriptional LysR family regulator